MISQSVLISKTEEICPFTFIVFERCYCNPSLFPCPFSLNEAGTWPAH